MIVDVFRWFAGGFLAPQATVRRLVSGGHGYDVAVQLFLLGFLFEAIVLVSLGDSTGQSAGVGTLIGGLLGSAIQLALVVFLVYRLGRFVGGTASLQDVALGVTWWGMMSALLSPFLVLFVHEMLPIMEAMAESQDPSALSPPSGSGILGAMFATGMIIWLLANMVAAVHGFRNIWGVLGVVVGLPAALIILVSLVTGGGAA